MKLNLLKTRTLTRVFNLLVIWIILTNCNEPINLLLSKKSPSTSPSSRGTNQNADSEYPSSLTTPSGQVLAFGYNSDHSIATVRYSPGDPQDIVYTFVPLNDSMVRADITHAGISTLISSWVYTFYNVGFNIVAHNSNSSNVVNTGTVFTFDSQGRVSNIANSSISSGNIWTYLNTTTYTYSGNNPNPTGAYELANGVILYSRTFSFDNQKCMISSLPIRTKQLLIPILFSAQSGILVPNQANNLIMESDIDSPGVAISEMSYAVKYDLGGYPISFANGLGATSTITY